MWLKWFPWRFIIKHLARTHGFLDPFSIISRLSRFAQPSEVYVAVELLRAGAVLHARGLINTKQHNITLIGYGPIGWSSSSILKMKPLSQGLSLSPI